MYYTFGAFLSGQQKDQLSSNPGRTRNDQFSKDYGFLQTDI